jgi:3,4-dihydroxy 2-butanone 4-phosphate synthase/GTP cyclohydrolase II
LEQAEILLDHTNSRWRAIVFEAKVDQRQLLALVKGDLNGDEPVLCRMHRGSTLADTFSSTVSEGGRNLQEAMEAIERAGRGVVVYLPPSGNLVGELGFLRDHATRETTTVEGGDPSRPHGGTLREYGLGAQVLRELGVRKLRLLTNNPRKIAGIHGYGLSVVESVQLVSMSQPPSK